MLALIGVAALTGGAAARRGPGTADLDGLVELVGAEVPRATAITGAQKAAARALSTFSADLFTAVAGVGAGTLVCSPYSVAVALGMTVQGAKGTTAAQMLDVLQSPDAKTLADGLNAIDLALAARSGSEGRIELSTANSLWGQRGIHWQSEFLEILGRDFGTGMRVVDYARAEAARGAINAWVSEQTRARIPILIPPGVLTSDTRLTLVNALYFKAAWQVPFEPRQTRSAPFHRLDGSSVNVQLMTGEGDRFASGPGWAAVDLPYRQGKLAMAVILPEAGRFAEVEKSLTGGGLAELLAGFEPSGVQVGLPRWQTRSQIGLGAVLAALGMPLAFTDTADFSGMTTDRQLLISAVVHEGFIAVDEAGTEAAAATAAIATEASARVSPVSVVADRPFLYVIHDRPTGVPLFIGRVLDPNS